MGNKEQIVELITDSGLDRIKHSLVNLLVDSVRAKTVICQDDDIQIGESKLGGRPDVPINFHWPTYENSPLYFIAQINMREISSSDTCKMLPDIGLLSFFYDALEQPWGFDPKDKGKWRVFHFDDVNDLQRITEPEKLLDQGTFTSCKLRFEIQTSFPTWETLCIEELNLNENEREQYWELSDKVAELNQLNGLIHRILGYPDLVQGEMNLQCQLVTNGIYCGDLSGYHDPRREELEKGVKDWKLLLQIDSEEEIGMMWGDVGRIYFWIREGSVKYFV